MTSQHAIPRTTGKVLHSAASYDLLLWLITFGREKTLREKVLRLARLKKGENILDIGCGTGTLAIAARQQVGPAGMVCGIDASPEMIARADKKAQKAGAQIAFKHSIVEAVPFPDAHFDVVLSTVMLHHLPRKARQQCAAEIRRVLKPGGRLLVVDFDGAEKERNLFTRFHRHGHINFPEMVTILDEAGLQAVTRGAVGISNLQYILAEAPCCA